jgi:hypothetical protein
MGERDTFHGTKMLNIYRESETLGTDHWVV